MIFKSYNNSLYLYYRFLIFLTKWPGIKIKEGSTYLINHDSFLFLKFRDPLDTAEKSKAGNV